MRAIYAASLNEADPLAGLVVGEREQPQVPSEWVPVRVMASALNHHDVWSLRGVGLRADQLPMILGCDAAGIDPDGNEVVVHAVIADSALRDETLDPARTLLSERYPGTLADHVYVPKRNLLPKPTELTFVEAACLPTSWLTAYRMLTTRGRLESGNAVLIQGAGGGVATAAAVLAVAHGARTYVTSRDGAKRERIGEYGVTAVEPGARLPERVDVVIETVGAPTFEHSLKACKPGGRIVIAGATAGHLSTVDLRRVFFLQLELVGSTMGTISELRDLLNFLTARGIRPVIDSAHPFAAAREAFAQLIAGKTFGKVVLDHR